MIKIYNAKKVFCKMNIDDVIFWVSTEQGKAGKELALLLKRYYKTKKDRLVDTTTIKAMFNEFFIYGDDSFTTMECEVVTNVIL